MTDDFRMAEKLLYDYPANVARVKILSEDLRVLRNCTDVKAQRYDNPILGGGQGHSDPVMSYLLKIETLEEEIENLNRLTIPITRLVEDLTKPYILENSEKYMLRNILEFYYFGGNPVSAVSEELHISRKTLYEKRVTLIKLVEIYLCIDFLIFKRRGSKS